MCMGVCETGSRLNCMALVPTAATTGTGRGSFVIHIGTLNQLRKGKQLGPHPEQVL